MEFAKHLERTKELSPGLYSPDNFLIELYEEGFRFMNQKELRKNILSSSRTVLRSLFNESFIRSFQERLAESMHQDKNMVHTMPAFEDGPKAAIYKQLKFLELVALHNYASFNSKWEDNYSDIDLLRLETIRTQFIPDLHMVYGSMLEKKYLVEQDSIFDEVLDTLWQDGIVLRPREILALRRNLNDGIYRGKKSEDIISIIQYEEPKTPILTYDIDRSKTSSEEGPKLGEIKDITPAQILRGTRTASDLTHRYINQTVKAGSQASLYSSLTRLQHFHASQLPASIFADDRFPEYDPMRANGCKDYTKSSFIGLRSRYVASGSFIHPSPNFLPYAWKGYNQTYEQQKEAIINDTKNGDTTRITAMFLSWIVNHFPVEGSGRIGGEIVTLMSDNRLHLSTNPYRTFNDPFQRKLVEAIQEFRMDIYKKAIDIFGLDYLGQSFIRSNNYHIFLMAEHNEALRAAMTGEFSEEYLQDNPAAAKIKDLFTEALNHKYIFLDEESGLDQMGQRVLDDIVEQILKKRYYTYKNNETPPRERDSVWHARMSKQLKEFEKQYGASEFVQLLRQDISRYSLRTSVITLLSNIPELLNLKEKAAGQN